MSAFTQERGDRYAKSRLLNERASGPLAAGVTTAFRAFERPVPLFIAEASGAHLVDADGNRYVDYVCGFGPIILGHGHEVVSDAVARAARTLQQVGGQHEGEIRLAERLCELVPSFERIRLGMSGSEGSHAAIRLARAATGRPLIVKFAGHYHGWFDGILVGTASLPPGLAESAGQPQSSVADIVLIEWNDVEAIRDLFARVGDRIAAVITEALPCNQGVIYPADGYLEELRALTESAGSLLIFDEVVTGFRVGLGGAQTLFGVTPDLTVVAKAMGNGFPISAFGGRADLMDLVASNKVLHAGTFNGGGISVAAANATIDVLSSDPGIYERMRRLGQLLMTGLEKAGDAVGLRLVAQGPGPVFFTWFLEEGGVTTYRDHRRANGGRYARFAELLLNEGTRVIPAGRWYLNAAHTDDDVAQTLAATERALAVLVHEERHGE